MLTYKQHIENTAKSIGETLGDYEWELYVEQAEAALEALPIIFLEEGAMPEVGDEVEFVDNESNYYAIGHVILVDGALWVSEYKDGGTREELIGDMVMSIRTRQGKQVITVKGESDA
jgi:hypothetical protein